MLSNLSDPADLRNRTRLCEIYRNLGEKREIHLVEKGAEVEHMPHNRQVVVSNPARDYFFLFLTNVSFNRSTANVP